MPVITVKDKLDITLDFDSNGISCVMWRNSEDTDIVNVVESYPKMIERLFDYNQCKGKLTASGIQEFVEVRDSLQTALMQINEIIAVATAESDEEEYVE